MSRFFPRNEINIVKEELENIIPVITLPKRRTFSRFRHRRRKFEAVEEVEQVVEVTVEEVKQITKVAVEEIIKVAVEEVEQVTEVAIEEVAQVTEVAIEEVAQVTEVAIEEVAQVTEVAIEEVEQVTEVTIEEVEQVTEKVSVIINDVTDQIDVAYKSPKVVVEEIYEELNNIIITTESPIKLKDDKKQPMSTREKIEQARLKYAKN
jgi:hypothetical protein